MAGDWMKIELDLPDKPEVHAIAGMLNMDPAAVVGHLIKVWAWFDKHTENGHAFGVTQALLDRVTGVTGLGEAMTFAGWLEQHDKTLIMPKFDRHTSESAKKRALAQKRKSRQRHVESVTETRPEKRREEKNIKDQILSADADPWTVGKEYLIANGVSKSNAGSIIGKWAKDNGQPAVISALQASIDAKPAQPIEFITAILQNRPKKFDPVASNAAWLRSQQ